MAAFKKGDKVTVTDLGIIGCVTGAKDGDEYEVEYYGPTYEIVSRIFPADDLALADPDSPVGQQALEDE